MKLFPKNAACFKVQTLCAAIVVCGISVDARAAPFQNLDFESAVVGTLVNGWELPASQALPFWNNNNWDPGYVGYGTIALDSVCVSIHDGRSGLLGDFNPIQRNYTALLQGGFNPANSGQFSLAYISQVGDVPTTANSLLFSSDKGGDDITVSLNGTAIPMSLYSVGLIVNPNFGPVVTYIGDIRAFTGQQNVTLQFTGGGDLDNIRFSSTLAPEPSTFFLLFVALLSLAGYYWQRGNRAAPVR
jgi:hypothetical protein